jgi:cystathionine beta-lyase/cystathionine gamma-synthase
MPHLRTRAVHAGRPARPGPVCPPLDLSTTSRFVDVLQAGESTGAMAAGGPPLHDEAVYQRLHNPNVADFEAAMAALEGADGAVAFASGMAAVTAALMLAQGAEVVALRPLYGSTERLMIEGITGARVRFADDLAGVRAAVGPQTALVWAESPSNPTLRVAPIAALVEAAAGAPVLIDATFATPALLQPLRHGATWSLHSATKGIGGHSDALGGVLSGPADGVARLRRLRVFTGGVLHPLAAWMLHRGLQTLPLRVAAAQRTATTLAARLQAHPAVQEVHHPSLRPDELAAGGLEGPGAMLSFAVGSAEQARRLLQALRLITPAVSLGGCESLMEHPASLTRRVVDAGGVSGGLLRMSVGLEHEDDLWADLEAALAAAGEGA